MRPGCSRQYEPWAERVAAVAQAAAGFASMVRLDQEGGMHHLLLHFDDADALHGWCGSDAYAALREEADGFSVGLDQDNREAVARFLIPSEAAAKKWKTALVTWIAVIPTLLVLSSLVERVLPNASPVVQKIVSSGLLTAALTWAILPRVRGWSRFWMLQNRSGDLRRKSA